MIRTTLFITGVCLALASAAYSALHPFTAARFAWTLGEADSRVLLLMSPVALAGAASLASIVIGWRLHRDGRTFAMVVALLAGTVLPPLAATLGHRAICPVVCRDVEPAASPDTACAIATERVSAQRRISAGRVASCDHVPDADGPPGYDVMALHAHCHEAVCGSTNMGWFAVRKTTGEVFEWDVAEGKLGSAVHRQP